MSDTLKNFQGTTVCGLGTWTFTAPISSMFFLSAMSMEVPPSGLTVTLSQSGSTSVSVSTIAPSASQSILEIQNIFNCIVADVLTVTISSSTPIDEQLNTVKTNIVVRTGQ